MTRQEIIHKLYQKGYTYEQVGRLFGITRQRAHSIDKVTRAGQTANTACDLCNQEKVSVKLREKVYHLCRDCWKECIRYNPVTKKEGA